MTARRKPEDAPDHVDGILAQWARERPDLDASPMGILGRLGRLNRHTGRAIEAALGATGLQPWEFDVLATLRRAGPPYALSPGALIGSLAAYYGGWIDSLLMRFTEAMLNIPSLFLLIIGGLNAGVQPIRAA